MFPYHQMLMCVVYTAVIGVTQANSLGGSTVQLKQLLQDQLHRYAASLQSTALYTHERYRRSRDPLNPRSRSRRSTDYKHSYVAGTGAGNREELQLEDVTAINGTALEVDITAWEYFSLDDQEYLATIQPTNERVEVFQVNLESNTPLVSYFNYSVNASDIEVFHLKRLKRAGMTAIHVSYLAIVSDTDDIILLTAEAGTFQINQTISLDGITDIESFDINALSYLAVAIDTGAATKSRLYKWSATYTSFVFSQELSTGASVKASAFTIVDNIYVAFAERNNQSIVFRYSKSLAVFKIYERLLSVADGASYVSHISAGYTDYLAFIVPSRNVTVFYKWNVRTFDEFQELSTPNGMSWTALTLPNCQDGTLLLLSSDLPSPYTLQMYQHSSSAEQFTQMTDDSVLGARSTVAINQLGGPVYIAVAFNRNSPYSQPSILQVMASSILVMDPFQQEVEALQQYVEEEKEEVTAYEEAINETMLRINDAVTIDGDQVISGIKNFIASITINGSINVAEIEIEGDSYVPMHDGHDGNLDELEERLANNTNDLLDVSRLLNNTVTLDTKQSVTGFKQFTNVTIDNDFVTANLVSDEINGISIQQLDTQAVRLDKPSQTIAGPLTFTQSVNITSDLSVGGQINGLDFEADVVLTDREQTITGAKTFDSDISVTGNVNMTDDKNINGLDVSKELVTLDGAYVLAGDIIFQDGMNISSNIITSSTVDGVNLTALVTDIMTAAGNQTISGPVIMQSGATFNTNVTVTGLINNMDMSDIEQRAVKINEDTQITGPKTFQGNQIMLGNMTVGGMVDGISLPEDVLTLAGDQTITGEKTFTGSVNITAAIHVTGLVDGLDLSEDLITLSGNHTVNGEKSFSNGIDITGDVIVTGTVDGVDVSQLKLDIMTLSTDQTIQDDITFLDAVIFSSHLTVNGLINGINVIFLYEDTVFKDSEDVQVITGSKIFTGEVNVSTGILDIFGSVNGYNMATDFLDKISDQSVTGVKTFVNGFSVQSNITVAGLIAGIDLNKLYREAVLTWRDAIITGHKIFLSSVTIDGSLIMTDSATVAGVDVSDDFMMTNRQQTVTGLKRFKNMEVAENLAAYNLIVTETFNGRNWTDFILNRITLTTDQVLDGNYTFMDVTYIIGDMNVDGTVNGVNTSLADIVLSKSKVQNITGTNTFTGSVSVVGDIIISGLVDGIDISLLDQQAMYINRDQNISGDKIFVTDVNIDGDLSLLGLLNGISITWLIQDAVYSDSGSQQVTAQKDFLIGFNATQSVIVTGVVDGIDLSEDLLTVSDAQTISGQYTFVDNVTVNANFQVIGVIDGVDLKELNATVMRTDIAQTVSAKIVFMEDVNIDNDTPVSGLVDGVDLSELDLTAVKLNEPFTINGDLSFTTPITCLDDINATGLIHGLDFAKWASEVITIDTEQIIPSLRIFTDDITVAAGITVSGNLTANIVFGRNFNEFIADAVLLEGNQNITGYKVFDSDLTVLGDIYVTGTVDGIKLATDAVTLDGDQVISGVKTFMNRLTVNGDIVISGLVNGVDINVKYNDTFLINDPCDILARKIFEQTLTVIGNLSVIGLVDGVDIDQEAVTLHTDQVVSGVKTFIDGMNVVGHVHITEGNNICEVTLSDLYDDRVSLSEDETLMGTLSFTGHVTFEDDVAINTLVNGVDLQKLQALQDKITEITLAACREIAWIIDIQCEAIDTLQSLYMSVFADLIHLSHVQTISEHSQSFEMFTIDDVPYLAMARMAEIHGGMCTDSIIYKWNETQGLFVEEELLPTRGGTKWHSFWMDSVLFLAIANNMVVPCPGDSAINNTIYFYNGSHFEHFHDIDSGGSNEIETIVIGDDTLLVVANGNNALSAGYSYVYIFDSDTERFVKIQNISNGDSSAVEFCTVGEYVVMVLSDSQADLVSVYVYNEETQQFYLNHTLVSGIVSSLTCYIFRDQTGLVIANHGYRSLDGQTIDFNGDLSVYYWSDVVGAFEFSTLIPTERVVDVDAFIVADYLYISAACQYIKFELFKYQGTINFVSVLSQEWNGIVSIEVFNMAYNNHIHFAVGIDPIDPDDQEFSMVLDGNIIGEAVDPVEGLCDHNFATPEFHDDELELD